MTLSEARDLAARITGRRLARALGVQSMAFCRATINGRVKKYATVASSTGAGIYYVTGTACTCPGFEKRGWCKHFDAVCLALEARAQMAQGTGAEAPTLTADPAPIEAERHCEDCGQALDQTDSTVLCRECFDALMLLLDPDGSPLDGADVDALAEVA